MYNSILRLNGNRNSDIPIVGGWDSGEKKYVIKEEVQEEYPGDPNASPEITRVLGGAANFIRRYGV